MFAAEDFREVPIDHVVMRASSFALSECTTYFEQVRDSLRNIQIKCGGGGKFGNVMLNNCVLPEHTTRGRRRAAAACCIKKPQ
jgi:hypothetical protein